MLYVFGLLFIILAFKGMEYPVACVVYTIAAVICGVFGAMIGLTYTKHKDMLEHYITEIKKGEMKNEEI
jgi:Na+(H+)/acetate symporter ActP